MKNTLKAFALAATVAIAALSFAQKPHAKISAARAEKVAIAKYHGKLAGRTDLENEDGKWQYSVTVRSGRTMREVMVDANTGMVASVEIVSAKEEARERAAEAKHNKKSPHQGH